MKKGCGSGGQMEEKPAQAKGELGATTLDPRRMGHSGWREQGNSICAKPGLGVQTSMREREDWTGVTGPSELLLPTSSGKWGWLCIWIWDVCTCMLFDQSGTFPWVAGFLFRALGKITGIE